MAKVQIISEIIYNQPQFYTLFNKELFIVLSHALHALMTVMTDDSFLNLRGKESLVNIYYNIYNTNLNHAPIFNNCHLSSVIPESQNNAHPARNRRNVIFEARKLRLRGHEITVRLNDAIKREQNHACMSSAEREHLRC